MEESVRINVRVPVEINEWLDAESKRTGVPKSSLVYFAVEKYIEQKQGLKSMSDFPELIKKLEELSKNE